DFADSTSAELDVEAAALRGFLAIDLVLQPAHFGGRLRERFGSKDNIPYEVQETSHYHGVAGGTARPYEGLALPALSLVSVVIGGSFDLPDRVALAAVRPEPQVDPINRRFARGG